MKGLNLIVFDDPEKLRILIEKLGFTVGHTYGHITSANDDWKPKKCPSCEKLIELEHIGHIFPPDQFYCDDPVCVLHYLEKQDEEEDENGRCDRCDKTSLFLIKVKNYVVGSVEPSEDGWKECWVCASCLFLIMGGMG